MSARFQYEHGGGLDAPLAVVRLDYSDDLRDPQVIVPHATWRGSYDRGTTIGGMCLVYSTIGTTPAPPPDSTPSSGDQYGGVVGGGVMDQGFGFFTYTGPRRGSESGFQPDPSAAGFTGVFHSHGANSHGIYNDEHFSEQGGDKDWSDYHNTTLYLVTPSGVMQRYDADPNRQRRGTVTVLGHMGP